MNWYRNSSLQGKHAVLSPSKWQWINDDEEGIIKRLRAMYAQQIGTILHSVAEEHIIYGTKLKSAVKSEVILRLRKEGIPGVVVDSLDFDAMFENLMNYTNDAIGFRMEAEMPLEYSKYCFGHADAIQFYDNKRFLRIHDLKTGTTPAHMEQLIEYAAIFCLQYHFKPYEFESELRIYQSGEIISYNPTPEDIVPVMDQIIEKDKFLKSIGG